MQKCEAVGGGCRRARSRTRTLRRARPRPPRGCASTCCTCSAASAAYLGRLGARLARVRALASALAAFGQQPGSQSRAGSAPGGGGRWRRRPGGGCAGVGLCGAAAGARPARLAGTCMHAYFCSTAVYNLCFAVWTCILQNVVSAPLNVLQWHIGPSMLGHLLD